MSKPKPKLTVKQEKFCNEYLVDLNAAGAARRAKYSIKSCKLIGHQNITKLNIQKRIQQLRKELKTESGLTPIMVIDEYKKIAFSNVQDYLGESNEIIDLTTIAREKAAAVESVQIDIRHDSGKDAEGYTEKIKFKLYSKLNALDSLGKHLGIFLEDNKQKADSLATALAEAVKCRE